MKRLVAFLSILFCLYIFGLVSAQQKATPPAAQELPSAEDTQTQTVWFPFNGQWLPDQDASLIGAKNFKTV